MPDQDDAVAEVRAFNRFYTGRIGLLDETQLESPFTLTEMRVLYELAQRPGLTAGVLCRDLRIDPGYCSRILKRLGKQGLVGREVSKADGRQSVLALTEAGRRAFAPLDAASRRQVGAMLAALPDGAPRRVVGAMRTIRRALAGAEVPGWTLRDIGRGDLGWIVHRHGVLYGEEYGLDARFEALVAEIAGSFVRDRNPACEAAWVAEVDGEVVGSVFVVRKAEGVAQLRLLYVEPVMRGHGLGRALVERAIGFARVAGYREMTLWTNDVLTAARHLYERAGFRLVAAEPHRSFGQDLVGETWTLEIA